MGKNSFILYTEIWPAIQKLDMEQRGKLFTAIMKHALCEDPEKLDILTDVIFTFIASQMDRDSEKYQEVCARRAEYGRRGGLATAKQKQAKASKTKQIKLIMIMRMIMNMIMIMRMRMRMRMSMRRSRRCRLSLGKMRIRCAR